MELIRMVFDFEFLFLKCKRVHLQPTENLIYLHYHHGANSLVFMSVQCSCERERERGRAAGSTISKIQSEPDIMDTREVEIKYIFICNMIKI